jgi:small subunit ribosomal protein S20
MPVTKTAKRALRSAKRKLALNNSILKKLEVAIRLAKKSKTLEKITVAISLADRAAKKNVIHKNKAARIKSTLSKLLPKAKSKPKAKPKPRKKTSIK